MSAGVLHVENVSRAMAAAQYTGTNGAELLALVQGITQYSANTWSVASDDGATLVLVETGPTAAGLVAPWPIRASQWVVCDMSIGIIAILDPDRFALRYRDTADVFSVALAQTGSIGIALVPSLTGNGQTAVGVPIRPIQPDTSYLVSAQLAGGDSLLGSLSILSTVKTSGSVVTVTVRNSGLLTLSGALVLVNTTAAP